MSTGCEKIIPSPAKEVLVFGWASNTAGVSTVDVRTDTLRTPDIVIGRVGEGAMLQSAAAASHLYFTNRDLVAADLATGAWTKTHVPGGAIMAYPHWLLGEVFITQDPQSGGVGILDTTKPGVGEQWFKHDMPYKLGASESAIYAAVPTDRGLDLRRISVPDGAETTVGWLSAPDHPRKGPVTFVAGGWVYVFMNRSDSVTDSFSGPLYRYKL